MTIEASSFWVGPPAEPDTYQLINTLGTGGEGQVWRAVVPLSDAGRRQVAVKILASSGSLSEQQWSRFGHLLKSLSHPGLVRVSEVFTGPVMHRYQQTPPPSEVRYVVMDFVDGITLTEWLAETPDATVAARIAMLRTVAAALDEMHSGRTTEIAVAHGDVKPANIILKPDGGTVLVDLGLARLSDAAGVSGRTNPYAAPELHADGAQATPESDAFAFCATLAHLLIGQPPPLDTNGILDLNALSNLLATQPLTQRRPALVRQIMIALAARPELRPRRLGEWINATGDSVSQVTSNALPPAPFEPGLPPPFQPVGGPPTPSLSASTPNRSANEPTSTETRRRGALVPILVVLGIVLAAVTYAAGAITHPSWAASINPIPAAAAVTSTQTVAGSTTTVTDTVTAASSPVPGPTPTTTNPTRTTPSTAVAGQAQYIIDSDWQTYGTSFITAGQALVKGDRHPNSFVLTNCEAKVIVPLTPGGHASLSGSVTYADKVNGPDTLLVVSWTRDQLGPQATQPIWQVLANIDVSTQKLNDLTAEIPPNAVALKIEDPGSCTAGDVVLIDPLLT